MAAESATKCEYHFPLHDEKLTRHESEIKDLDDRVTNVEKKQCVSEEKMLGILEKISRLPEAIEALKESNITVHNKLDQLSEKTDKIEREFVDVKNEINTIDKKDQISILGFVKDNIWKILAIFAALYALWISVADKLPIK